MVVTREMLWLSLALTMATTAAMAQQPVRPLPKLGSCPLCYYSSGSYCVPNPAGTSREAIEMVGTSCP